MRKLLLALILASVSNLALAQAPVFCPTRPLGDNTNACASTAFVIANAGGGGGTPGGLNTQVQFNNAGSFGGSANLTWVSPVLSIGQAGSVVGQIKFLNATSGSISVEAVTGALGAVTLSLPAATDTLVGKATTDTFTNKTYDTAGTGNSFLINGLAVTANTGTGAVVRATSPTLVTPALGTPSSGTLTNATGLPVATGISGLGTGVATALAVNVGSAGAFVTFNGALGTPSSGTVTNLTGTASININGTVGATTPNTGAFTSLAYSTTLTGTSSNSSALAIGPNGATNPVLRVDASTASAATGLTITGAAAGSRIQLTARSSGADEGLSLDAKGTGTIRLGATSTGAIEFSRNAVPTASDGAALGTTALQWSDLFLATGAVINYNNGANTLTHISDGLVFTGTTPHFQLGTTTTLISVAGANATFTAVTDASADWGIISHTYGNISGAGGLVFSKTRNASPNSHTIVQNNDSLGSTVYYGSDGTNYIPAANIRVVVDGTPGANDMPGRISLYTTPDGTATPVEGFRLDNAGQVTARTGTVATSSITGALVITGSGGIGVGGALWVGTYVATTPTVVGSLPTCNAGTKSARMFVTDSNAASFTAGIGAIVAAGGTTNVPVTCDGTNWRIG